MAASDQWDGEERRDDADPGYGGEERRAADRPPAELLAERTAELAATRHTMASLGDQVAALADAATRLASKEDISGLDSKGRRRLWSVVVIIAVLVGFPIVSILVSNVQANDQRERLVGLTETLNDCVNPSGECYDRGQRGQGRAIAAINFTTVAGAECAFEVGIVESPDQIRPCIEDKVRADLVRYDQQNPPAATPEPVPDIEPKEGPVDQLVEVQLNEDTVQLLVAFVIPLLVALATKFKSSSGLKAVLNLGLTVLATALLNVVDAGGTLVVNHFLNDLARNFALSIATYYGLWKSTGVAGSIAVRTGRFGLGSPPALETADKGAEDVGEAMAAAEASEETAAVEVIDVAEPVEVIDVAEPAAAEDDTGEVGMRVATSDDDLKAQARLLEIPGRSKMRKAELADAVEAELRRLGTLID